MDTNVPDPLQLLQHDGAWPKLTWKDLVQAYHENLCRDNALINSEITLLGIQLFCLNGCHQPALFRLETTSDVERLRPHMKMITGDFWTYSRLAQYRKIAESAKLTSLPIHLQKLLTTFLKNTWALQKFG